MTITTGYRITAKKVGDGEIRVRYDRIKSHKIVKDRTHCQPIHYRHGGTVKI